MSILSRTLIEIHQHNQFPYNPDFNIPLYRIAGYFEENEKVKDWKASSTTIMNDVSVMLTSAIEVNTPPAQLRRAQQ
jgi:hypothetical protein